MQAKGPEITGNRLSAPQPRVVIGYHPRRKSDISRWGARTSNPVGPANAGSAGSTPASSATSPIPGSLTAPIRDEQSGLGQTVNDYYPSPEMHLAAARKLFPVCRELWTA